MHKDRILNNLRQSKEALHNTSKMNDDEITYWRKLMRESEQQLKEF